MMTVFHIEEKPKNSPALIANIGVQVTYGELSEQMEAFETLFPSRSLVFCMCRNEPGAVVGYLGTMAAGCVPLLLAADLKDAQFMAFFETYRPAYIWASADWMKAHSGMMHNPSDAIGHDVEGRLDGQPENAESRIPCGEWKNGLQDLLYEAYGYGLWATGNAPYEMHPDLGLLLATSGSTGDPKLVRLSHRNLLANAESICEYLQLDTSERPITTLPMQYTYGLSIINSHLLAGAAILMTTAGYVQSAFWTFFEQQGATSFGGVPYTYEILKKIHLFQKKLPSLRSITQAGGKLSVSLQKEVAEWAKSQGVRFFVMYGQTEATARMGFLPPEMCLEKLGSMGIAIPGGRFFLADENGKEICGDSDIGELVYVGDNVSLGYAKCPGDLRLGNERHGVLFTGDLARRDADGYYYIVGRKKRFVKIFGVRVSLDACEQTLREWYPGVDLACAGSDDCLNIYMAQDGCEAFCGGGEHVGRGEGAPGWNAAGERLADYLHLNRRAFQVILRKQIPKNSAGKILYRQL